jgi:hypothetical protein
MKLYDLQHTRGSTITAGQDKRPTECTRRPSGRVGPRTVPAKIRVLTAADRQERLFDGAGECREPRDV